MPNHLIFLLFSFFLAVNGQCGRCPTGTECDTITRKCTAVSCSARNACGTNGICIPEERFCIRAPCPQFTCGCTEEARICPDGTTVARDPTRNCEFYPPCPDAARCSDTLPCQGFYTCVDDASDSCDPIAGDLRCPRVCKWQPCAFAKCSRGFHCEQNTGNCVPDHPPCGGIAGVTCAEGYECVDDPSDDCDPNDGGADCGGFCREQFCGGIAAFPCPEGFDCEDDPSDDCDPNNGGADCGGICKDPCALIPCQPGTHCSRTTRNCAPDLCCDPRQEPGQFGNPLCIEGHRCCSITGQWICSIGDGQTFSPCPGREQGPFGTACSGGGSGGGLCCNPRTEPGQFGNPLCIEGHRCCSVTGEWVCSIGDGRTFSPCPGREQGPFGSACTSSGGGGGSGTSNNGNGNGNNGNGRGNNGNNGNNGNGRGNNGNGNGNNRNGNRNNDIPRCANVRCDAGYMCDENTGTCVVDRCAVIRCRSGYHCDSAVGTCVPN